MDHEQTQWECHSLVFKDVLTLVNTEHHQSFLSNIFVTRNTIN